MKKLFPLFFALFLVTGLQAQDVDRNSLTTDYLTAISKEIPNLVPRFRLYKTENVFNFIRLDSATGALWQVQMTMKSSAPGKTVPINEESLLQPDEALTPGRFELYPTNNMFIFILLDTQDGATYQVQWSSQPEKRSRTLLQ